MIAPRSLAARPEPARFAWPRAAAGAEFDGRRPERLRAHAARTVLRATHLVRHLAETLVDRPLSLANTPVVLDSFRALELLAGVVDEKLPLLPPQPRAQAAHLRDLVAETLRQPNPQTIFRLGRFIRDEMSFYTTVMQPPALSMRLPPNPFRGQHFTHLVIMVGPGIGIGDEIKLNGFFRQLRAGLGIAADDVALFSFCPWLWKTLMPDVAVSGLAQAPLAAYERLDAQAEGRPLMVFACFMRQDSPRLLAVDEAPRDGLSLTLASGEIVIRFRGEPRERVACRLLPEAPNYSLALARLERHLFPCLPMTYGQRVPFSARSHHTIRLVLNPFTSKHSPLTPADWARFLSDVRRALPRWKELSCRIVPGLTSSCRRYAEEIQAHARRLIDRDTTVELLDQKGPQLVASEAIPAVHAALLDADLLLTIDTYTAHLAAHLRLVSITLCLNRNVQFWDPALHTFWLDIGAGYRSVSTMIRAIASLAAREQDRGGPLAGAIDACRTVLASAPPDALTSDLPLPIPADSFQARADALWAALPPPVARALAMLDGDYAWPMQRSAWDPRRSHATSAAADRIRSSLFFRLAALGAATQPTRGRVS